MAHCSHILVYENLLLKRKKKRKEKFNMKIKNVYIIGIYFSQTAHETDPDDILK